MRLITIINYNILWYLSIWVLWLLALFTVLRLLSASPYSCFGSSTLWPSSGDWNFKPNPLFRPPSQSVPVPRATPPPDVSATSLQLNIPSPRFTTAVVWYWAHNSLGLVTDSNHHLYTLVDMSLSTRPYVLKDTWLWIQYQATAQWWTKIWRVKGK